MRSSARYWSSPVLAVKPKLWRWPTTATTVSAQVWTRDLSRAPCTGRPL
jgi:hypothetical protein